MDRIVSNKKGQVLADDTAPAEQELNGFGIVTSQGRFLWQYSRPDAAQARAAYERHNPQLEGHPDGHRVVKLQFLLLPE